MNDRITLLQKKLNELVETEPLDSEKVLKLSQELDYSLLEKLLEENTDKDD